MALGKSRVDRRPVGGELRLHQRGRPLQSTVARIVFPHVQSIGKLVLDDLERFLGTTPLRRVGSKGAMLVYRKERPISKLTLTGWLPDADSKTKPVRRKRPRDFPQRAMATSSVARLAQSKP